MPTVIRLHPLPSSIAMRILIVIGILISSFLHPPTASAVEKHVYLINNSDKVALTGFRVRGGERGIITCLHGVAVVAKGKQITARNAVGEVFTQLKIKRI